MPGRRKKKPQTHEDTHRWVVSYADFITLLFAFFVVMYAISSLNVSKYRSLADSMQTAFDAKGGQPPKANLEKRISGEHVAGGEGHQATMMSSLDEDLSKMQDSDLEVQKMDGWIEVDIKAGSIFRVGRADLRPMAFYTIMKMANHIKKNNFPISIEGYTDNIPIDSPIYPSNWELSSARAAAVARALILFGVAPDRITITGYGDLYPVGNNDTEKGRSENRRVNLIIARDRSIPRLMNPALSPNQQKKGR